MKTLLLISSFFIFSFSFSWAQSDTTKIYIINKTNKFLKVSTEGRTTYSFFYRDLKGLKKGRELVFKNNNEVEEFFDKAEKVLATNNGILTSNYNLFRNKLNKNVLRLQNKEGGYVLLSRETLETMRSEFDKHKT